MQRLSVKVKTLEWLRKNKVLFVQLETEKAIYLYKKEAPYGGVVALLHSTC